MTVATLPVIASRKQRRVWFALMLALFFGLLSLALVREIRVDCRSEAILLTDDQGRLLTADDGTTLLTADDKRRQCQLDIGDVWVALPTWVQAIIE